MADQNKAHQDRIHGLIKEVESLAKSLRTNLRKRTDVTPVLKEVQKAADRLRKQAATTAGQVERYVHSIRKELEKSATPKKKTATKKTAKKRAARKATKTKTATSAN